MILKEVYKKKDSLFRKEFVISDFDRYELYPNEDNNIEISCFKGFGHDAELKYTNSYIKHETENIEYVFDGAYIMTDKGETIERIV